MIKNYNRVGQTQSLKGASWRRSSRGRRHVFISSACVCALIIALGVTENTTLPWLANVVSSEQPQPADGQEMRIGTIEVQTGQDQCDLLKFDNDSGRTINESKSCHGNVALDAHGVPVPTGTVHRLDSISKSFLGGQ
ncbi:MAG: hypothetical protein WBC94_00990 [Xanthobacteraceae bacterium]